MFSFNGNKIITTSGGGMLVSHRPKRTSTGPATWPPRPASRRRTTSTREIGYNYRLSNLLAAVGRGQLHDARREGRAPPRDQRVATADGLDDVAGIEFMPDAPYGEPTNWLTCITVDPAVFGVDREDIRQHLEQPTSKARPVWKPMHLQPVFAACPVLGGAVSQRAFEHGPLPAERIRDVR